MDVALQIRPFLIRCWQAGVDSVKGERVTAQAIANDRLLAVPHILAIGKAASSMCLGALPVLSHSGRMLLITKYGHVDSELRKSGKIEIIESGHPIPDKYSLYGGRQAIRFVRSIPATENLVMLVSGGASALVECLPDNIDLEALKMINECLLSEGFSIDQINAIRVQISEIKGGKLLNQFTGKQVHVYAISDVPGDDIHFIGSGIGGTERPVVPAFKLPKAVKAILDSAKIDNDLPKLGAADRCSVRIVASNTSARNAVEKYAKNLDYEVISNSIALNGDVEGVAKLLSRHLLAGKKGVYIWGGEPTIVLPTEPGIGGRNQSLALAIAREISGYDNISVIVGGTDGSDGPTRAAGGVVDGTTFTSAEGGEMALLNADAGSFLKRANALFVCGPTGTNVMDLVVGIKF